VRLLPRRRAQGPSGPVLCPCGTRLADLIDGDEVVIDGVTFRFARRNDTLVCPGCRTAHPVTKLRADASPARPDTGERRRRSD
jgi:hypothetical protein